MRNQTGIMMRFTITAEDIPKQLIQDWQSDSISNNWAEFIARRLNAAIKLGLIVPKERYDAAVEQDYCTLCGNLLKTPPL